MTIVDYEEKFGAALAMGVFVDIVSVTAQRKGVSW
jgi:hypothetical protein